MRRVPLAFVLALVCAATALAGDVTGRWVGSVDTPNGPIELTYDLKVEGEVLSGSVTSAMGTVALSNGKVAGQTLTYDVQVEAMTITHEATVNADGSEITVKATGDWGTSEYVVKKVDAPK